MSPEHIRLPEAVPVQRARLRAKPVGQTAPPPGASYSEQHQAGTHSPMANAAVRDQKGPEHCFSASKHHRWQKDSSDSMANLCPLTWDGFFELEHGHVPRR
jgi:hypothetical protein